MSTIIFRFSSAWLEKNILHALQSDPTMTEHGKPTVKNRGISNESAKAYAIVGCSPCWTWADDECSRGARLLCGQRQRNSELRWVWQLLYPRKPRHLPYAAVPIHQ